MIITRKNNDTNARSMSVWLTNDAKQKWIYTGITINNSHAIDLDKPEGKCKDKNPIRTHSIMAPRASDVERLKYSNRFGIVIMNIVNHPNPLQKKILGKFKMVFIKLSTSFGISGPTNSPDNCFYN